MVADVVKRFVPTPVKEIRRFFLRRKWAAERAERERIRHRFQAILEPVSDIAKLVCQNTFVSKLTTETPEGVFAFYPGDSVIGWSIATSGTWESRLTDVLRGLVSPGDVVIDVGANLGWYSVQLSRAAGDEGIVYAFEPEPRNFALLTENVRLNGVADRVIALNLAAAENDGVLDFELSPSNFGDHRVRFARLGQPDHEVDVYGESSRRLITVRATSLDNYFDANGALSNKRVCLIKLDCQGAEAAIVAGARKLLSRTDYLATEYWPYAIRRSGYDPQSFLEALSVNFNYFAELEHTEGIPDFRPTTALLSHASSLTAVEDSFFFYVFKRTI